MAYDVISSGRLSDLPFRAVGGQPAFEPQSLERFVAQVRVGVLAFTRIDGRPNQSPIWYSYRDGVLFMSTSSGSPKHKALLRDPRVCLTIQDEAPPYRAVIIDGTVELSTIEAGAANPTDGLALRYFGRLGAREYEKLTAETYDATGLVLITLRPEAVRGFDNTRAVGKAASAALRWRNRLPIPRSWV